MAQSEAIDKGVWQGVRLRASGCDCVSQKKNSDKNVRSKKFVWVAFLCDCGAYVEERGIFEIQV